MHRRFYNIRSILQRKHVAPFPTGTFAIERTVNAIILGLLAGVYRWHLFVGI